MWTGRLAETIGDMMPTALAALVFISAVIEDVLP